MIERFAPNVHRIKLEFKSKSEERWLMLTGDQHYDNPHCMRDALKRDMDAALERNAIILSVGDFYCAMQGKYDPRRSKKDVRPEHNVSNYTDALVASGIDFWGKYKDLDVVLGEGNHETAILKNVETDLLERTVQGVKTMYQGKIEKGGYSGYLVLEGDYGGHKNSLKIYYHHGHGGGGVVTHGAIQQQRRATMIEDADLVVSGHVHEKLLNSFMKVSLGSDLTVKMREQLHITTPTYKEEFGGGVGDFHNERGRPPKPIGCIWIRLFIQPGTRDMTYETIMPKSYV